ncbi:fungal-specific transcription factor domain-containing protein [Phaeosphaeria sp. MPI-PUGE-AT-0046c]|nr:fungal-specific transcription factor domain-containing protein [Phaeosphaeria sp. MPI-PUGE-AT-0046c]
MPASSRDTERPSERRGRGHRGLTCSNCRTRKTRCDGSQPKCATCATHGDDCHYVKMPAMSQVLAMASKLQEAEETITRLQEALEARSSTPTPMESDRKQESPSLSISPSQSLSPEEVQTDLSIDSKGQLCYYGPTSAVHAPLVVQPAFQSSDTEARTILTSKAQETRTWEGFALGNAALQTDIPQVVIHELLSIHWTWIAPNFMWVYRPAFIRDMMTGGPYYSPFLLTVLCAHAARFGQVEMRDLLTSRARLLLGNEIHKPSSITTVQALLQLSARDLAYGSISQAWLYSGLAFRMVSDLGLHHNNAKLQALGHLTVEDLEIRRRLFWSCYFWDKAISLYLGRMPALPDLPLDHTPELLDDYTEHELWSPHQGLSMNLNQTSVGKYPPMKMYAISCFQNSCKLAIIINDIVLRLYSRGASHNVEQALRELKRRLDDWRAHTPAHLRLDPLDLPQVCPPTHIFAQNMLYFATIILLHRPFRTSQHHLECRNASHCLEQLIICLEKSFGTSHLTYLICYCIYTGASVIVLDVNSGDLGASTRMQTFLLQRSIDIINNSLAPQSHNLDTFRTCDTTNTNSAIGPYLPAFPVPENEVSYDMDFNAQDFDVDSFSFLNCFPEYQPTNVDSGLLIT